LKLQPIAPDVVSDVERDFILQAAKRSGIRLDGRSNFEARPCRLHVSTVANSRSLAICTLGDATKVSCSVSAEITQPFPDRPNEGMLSIQTEFMHSAGPLASSNFDLNLLERSMQKAIDVETLCLVPGLRVWSVRCQLIIIDDCGAVVDACSVAACAALLHFRRPDVTVVGEEITVHAVEDKIPIPLSVHYIPLCITFALIDTSLILQDEKERTDVDKTDWIPLLDPTEREELISKSGSFQVILTTYKEICGLAEGGPLLPRQAFKSLIEQAGVVRKDRGEVLDKTLSNTPFLVVG